MPPMPTLGPGSTDGAQEVRVGEAVQRSELDERDSRLCLHITTFREQDPGAWTLRSDVWGESGPKAGDKDGGGHSR